MTDPTRPEAPEPARGSPSEIRRWIIPAALSTALLVPIAILIFSNLEHRTVSWAGFEIGAPLWVILAVTFLAGMVAGKMVGWGWRRWRRRRKRLKEELEILRKHGADTET